MSSVSCSHAHRAHINPQLCLYLFSFVVKRVAGNLRCGKQVWSTMTRFSAFPSFLPPCAHTYRAQPCLSFLSQDPITLYPGFFPFSSSTTNRNLFITTSLVYVLYLPAVSPTKLVQKMLSFLPALQKQPRWCCPAKQADFTLVT